MGQDVLWTFGRPYRILGPVPWGVSWSLCALVIVKSHSRAFRRREALSSRWVINLKRSGFSMGWNFVSSWRIVSISMRLLSFERSRSVFISAAERLLGVPWFLSFLKCLHAMLFSSVRMFSSFSSGANRGFSVCSLRNSFSKGRK